MITLRQLALFALLSAAAPLHAVTYTVNDGGSGLDSNTNDNTCSTATPANTTSTLTRDRPCNTSPAATHQFAAAITRSR